jgi:hypothetical protein
MGELATFGYFPVFYSQALLTGFCEGYGLPWLRRWRPTRRQMAEMIEAALMGRCRLQYPRLLLLEQKKFLDTYFLNASNYFNSSFAAADSVLDRVNATPCYNALRKSDFKSAERDFRGMYTTCTVAVDLTKRSAAAWLLDWYELSLPHLQDQVSFPVSLWIHGTVAGVIPRDQEYFFHGPHGVARHAERA